MRRGEPVDVPGYLLPRSVRDSGAFIAAAWAGRIRGSNTSRSLTATVRPDGRIQFRDETPREWLEETDFEHAACDGRAQRAFRLAVLAS